jgi:hypothetical protein
MASVERLDVIYVSKNSFKTDLQYVCGVFSEESKKPSVPGTDAATSGKCRTIYGIFVCTVLGYDVYVQYSIARVRTDGHGT